MIDELINIKGGNYSNEGDIFYLQAKKVSIISKERDVTVAVDGESAGVLPATFQVIKNALNLLLSISSKKCAIWLYPQNTLESLLLC